MSEDGWLEFAGRPVKAVIGSLIVVFALVDLSSQVQAVTPPVAVGAICGFIGAFAGGRLSWKVALGTIRLGVAIPMSAIGAGLTVRWLQGFAAGSVRTPGPAETEASGGFKRGACMAGVVFYAASAQGWNSLYFVVRKLLSLDDRILERICVFFPSAPGYQWRFLNAESRSLFFHLAERFRSIGSECHLYVSTEMPPPGWSPARPLYRIIIPHGSGFGSSSYAVVTYLSSDLYCGHAPRQKTDVFDVFVPPGMRQAEFVATGNPRNDRFQEYVGSSREGRREIQASAKRMLGLSPERKMVLIASHWTPDGLLRTFGTGPIQAVSAMEENFQIVQGVHPNLWDDPQHDSFHITVKYPKQEGFSSRWIREALAREEARGVNVQPD